MKIFLLTVLVIFLCAMWGVDFINWCRSVNSKEYWWRLGDLCLTSAMIMVLIELAGR